MTNAPEGAPNTGRPTLESLDARRGAAGASLPDGLGLRLRRSLSWLGRAEREMADADHDAAFIFYWIAFNSAYQRKYSPNDPLNPTERELFSDYFRKVVKLDTESAISDAVWQKFSESIEGFLENHYVFQPFWNHLNRGGRAANWRDDFERDKMKARMAIAGRVTVDVLAILFDRLYVLRNQLMHGGATWSGSVNRAQVGDGARILAFLVPLFLKLMLDNPGEPWGPPRYPPVDG